MAGIIERFAHGVNIFTAAPERKKKASGVDIFDPPRLASYGPATTSPRAHETRVRIGNERSIIAAIYNKISVDASDVEFRHVRVDKDGVYQETIWSYLQYCFGKSANLDQAARHFRRSIVMTMLDEGHVVVVPTKAAGENPLISSAYDVQEMRSGIVTQWHPHHVRVRIYNDAEDKGVFEEITLPKRMVAIIENPFYPVMNEPNSTLQRIIHKLNLLDITDEKVSNGKMDLIIQLPYTIRTDQRRAEAEQRRQDIEFQLSTGRYGIAYADSTEKITQLNRPVDNNLWAQISGLMETLYDQLGITKEILNGSASEETMTNYLARTIEPILDAIQEEFERKFLSRTAVTQGQAVMFFRDPFKLVPISQLAEISDVLSRNEVVAGNEIRSAIGLRPSKDPKADQLNNSNMPETDPPVKIEQIENVEDPDEVTDAMLVEEEKIDSRMKELGI